MVFAAAVESERSSRSEQAKFSERITVRMMVVLIV